MKKELFEKIRSIIRGEDYQAHKNFAHFPAISKNKGSDVPTYSQPKNNDKLGYLLTHLTEDEQEQLKDFSEKDLQKILETPEKYMMYGLQMHVDLKRNQPKKLKGRWGL